MNKTYTEQDVNSARIEGYPMATIAGQSASPVREPAKPAAEVIRDMAFAEMEKATELSYSEAFQRVTTANPELVSRYFAELRGKRK